MTDVKAGVEYKINVDGNSFLLDSKKYQLLESILNTESMTESAKSIKVSYRTALNYIDKIESALNVKIVNTTKGGKGGGGGTTLTDEGYSILKECKKINAIMELHKDVNEIESEVLNVDVVVKDSDNLQTFNHDEKGTIEFKNVSFRYPGADEDVISNVSFKALPGETTAFIGSTGSGKSTLINLIPRFYDATEGEILIDGVNIKNVSQYDKSI